MHSWKSTYTPNCPKDLIKKLIYIPVYAVKYTHAYFIYSSDAESLHKFVSPISLTGISNYGNTNNVTKHLTLILREGKFKDGIHT